MCSNSPQTAHNNGGGGVKEIVGLPAFLSLILIVVFLFIVEEVGVAPNTVAVLVASDTLQPTIAMTPQGALASTSSPSHKV